MWCPRWGPSSPSKGLEQPRVRVLCKRAATMGAEDTLFQRFGKEFPKGTVLFSEGQPGKEMFVLQSGKVAISKKVRDVEKVLATLGPGEFFGEMAIISNKPRNA